MTGTIEQAREEILSERMAERRSWKITVRTRRMGDTHCFCVKQ